MASHQSLAYHLHEVDAFVQLWRSCHQHRASPHCVHAVAMCLPPLLLLLAVAVRLRSKCRDLIQAWSAPIFADQDEELRKRRQRERAHRLASTGSAIHFVGQPFADALAGVGS